jgi:hypothetical protein
MEKHRLWRRIPTQRLLAEVLRDELFPSQAPLRQRALPRRRASSFCPAEILPRSAPAQPTASISSALCARAAVQAGSSTPSCKQALPRPRLRNRRPPSPLSSSTPSCKQARPRRRASSFCPAELLSRSAPAQPTASISSALCARAADDRATIFFSAARALCKQAPLEVVVMRP